MPKLSISVSCFPVNTPSYNGTKTLDISKHRCLKFAATLGGTILQAGTKQNCHTLTMASYKALALKAAINFTGTQIAMPLPYIELDPTEKRNISFWTGMTFASIAANDILGVNKLLHAASMSNQGKLVRVDPKSCSLADFIGTDANGDWHIIEAKADQDNASKKDRGKWKNQAQTVASIERKTPFTCSYCFTRVASTYSVELIDPPSRDATQELSFPHGDQDIVNFYYGALRDELRNSNLIVERDGRTILLVQTAYDLADREYVFMGMEEHCFKTVEPLRGELPAPIIPFDGPDCYLGADGIALITSAHPTPSKF